MKEENPGELAVDDEVEEEKPTEVVEQKPAELTVNEKVEEEKPTEMVEQKPSELAIDEKLQEENANVDEVKMDVPHDEATADTIPASNPGIAGKDEAEVGSPQKLDRAAASDLDTAAQSQAAMCGCVIS